MIRALPVLLLAGCSSPAEPCSPYCHSINGADAGVVVEGRCGNGSIGGTHIVTRVPFATASQALAYVDSAGLVLCGGGR